MEIPELSCFLSAAKSGFTVAGNVCTCWGLFTNANSWHCFYIVKTHKGCFSLSAAFHPSTVLLCVDILKYQWHSHNDASYCPECFLCSRHNTRYFRWHASFNPPFSQKTQVRKPPSRKETEGFRGLISCPRSELALQPRPRTAELLLSRPLPCSAS